MSGPYFEDLVPGWRHVSAGTTLTVGSAAWYLALSGDSNPVHLDARIARGAGLPEPPLNTALVAHTMIGHSTVATREVVANLFYRDVAFLRPVSPGTTIVTETVVEARQEATPRPDRPPRGKVMLALTARDERGDVLAVMRRCALVRKSGTAVVAQSDDIDVDAGFASQLQSAVDGWKDVGRAISADAIWDGVLRHDGLVDPVTDALQLVRATGNLARAHRDVSAGQDGRRLVYGGHTLALAQASLARSVGGAHAVVAWERCSHPAPVFEEDVLSTAVEFGVTVHRDSLVSIAATTTKVHESAAPVVVQHWRPVVLGGA